jgi:hypothetical protein
MNFSEYGQVANPLKPPKGGPGGRRSRILETKNEKNNILIAIEKNNPDVGKNSLFSLAYRYVIANNCEALSI